MKKKPKDSILSAGFLLDQDVSKVASLLRLKRTYSVSKMGLSANATDADILQKAWEQQLIVVTGNDDHFVAEFLKFIGRSKINDCHDLHGLLVLPNGYENQKRLLQNIGKKLRFGTRKVTWTEVAQKNYYVKAKRDGTVVIKTFPQCFYCEKLRLKGKQQQ